jgi:uncharacterized phosphosugar-binding protein
MTATTTTTTRTRIRQLLDEADERCANELPAAAGLLLERVHSGGVVHVAGAGHSLVMVCETFYRAGGLSAVRPVWDPEILPLNGALRSTAAERRPGLGRETVRRAAPRPPDVMVVFSTSGRNPYPVEIAQECRELGVPVIAVTSQVASASALARSGTRLADLAEIVLDTGVPPGDAVHPAETPRTSPVSTIIASYLWTMLLAELDELAETQGVTLPRWTSSNVAGGDEANSELMRRYGPRIPELTAE